MPTTLRNPLAAYLAVWAARLAVGRCLSCGAGYGEPHGPDCEFR